MQTDNYGRVVEIDTERLISGMNSNVSKLDANTEKMIASMKEIVSAGTLAGMAKQSRAKRDELAEIVKPLIKSFSHDTAEINDYLESIKKILEETSKQKKKASTKDTLNFTDLTNSFEKALENANDGVWTEKRAKAVDHFLKEATSGHSIHVHDYTVASLLVGIAKDVKHIGMCIDCKPLSKTNADMVGKFAEKVADLEDLIKESERRSANSQKQFMGESRRGSSSRSFKNEILEALAGMYNNAPTPKPKQEPKRKSYKNRSAYDTTDGKMNPIDLVNVTEGKMNGKKGTTKPIVDLDNTLKDTKREQQMLQGASIDLAFALKNNSRFLGFSTYMMKDLAKNLAGMKGLSRESRDSIAKVLRQGSNLNKAESEKLRKAMIDLKNVMDKGTPAEKEAQVQKTVDLSNTLNDRVERRRSREAMSYNVDRFREYTSRIWNALQVFTPAHFGVGTEFNLANRMAEIREETGKWTRDIHHTLAQNVGLRGSLLQDTGGHGYRMGDQRMRGYFEEANYLAGGRDSLGLERPGFGGRQSIFAGADGFNMTGERDVNKIQAVLIRNLSRGVTVMNRWNQLSRQGLQLGRMIGVDAEQTSEELADWHLHMGLTVTQTGQLMRDIDHDKAQQATMHVSHWTSAHDARKALEAK